MTTIIGTLVNQHLLRITLIYVSLWGSITTCHAVDLPLRVQQITPLSFGKFSVTSPGAVWVNALSGNCTQSGGVVLVGSYCNYAVFEVTGTPQRRVEIMPPGRIDLTGPSSGKLSITRFITPMQTLMLGMDGRGRFNLGGSLESAGNPSPGVYNGMVPVTVQYSLQ